MSRRILSFDSLFSDSSGIGGCGNCPHPSRPPKARTVPALALLSGSGADGQKNGGGKVLYDSITAIVLFPPLPKVNEAMVKAYAKEQQGDRIVNVEYSDYTNRYGVEVKTQTGRRLYYTFDRQRIIIFDITAVRKSHRAYVRWNLLRFWPDDVIKACYRVRIPERGEELIEVYYTNTTLNRLTYEERFRVVKDAVKDVFHHEPTKVLPYNIDCSGNYGFWDVQEKAVKKPFEPTRVYVDFIHSSESQERRTFGNGYALIFRNIFENWRWWERSDMKYFFV